MTQNTQQTLALQAARSRANAVLAASQTHYLNADLKEFVNAIVACEDIFKADTETGQIPHRNKAQKVDPKKQILNLVRTLDHTCPRSLMVSAEPGTIDVKAGSLISHVDALSVKRSDLDRFDADAANRRALKKDRPARVQELREASKPIVEAIILEIRLLREGIQSKRTNTYSLKDNDPNLYRAFAQSFVAAAKKDQIVLNELPELRTLVNKTQCHLALLNYVDAVRTIAQEMKNNPPALWEDNRGEIAQKLITASDTFRKATPNGQRTTPDVYEAFTREDARARKATSATEVEKASEHLKDIALTFIMGGPPNPEKYGVRPLKEVPARPKIFTRISKAYKDDYKAFITQSRKREDDKHSGHISEEGIDPINPFTIECALMDHVYAARWVLAADRVEALVKSHIPMLADPIIDTVPAEEKPQLNAITQIQLRGKMARATEKNAGGEQPTGDGHVAHTARYPKTERDGRT